MMKKHLPLLIILVTMLGCKKDRKFSAFDNNLLIPIMSANLSLADIADDSVFQSNAQGELSLVYDHELFRGNVSEFFVILDTQKITTLSLESLALSDKTVSQQVPFFAIYPDAIFKDGQTDNIPAQSITTMPSTPLDGTEFFESATFNSGTMSLTVQNGFPVEMSTLIFELRNAVDNSLVEVDTFNNILPGTSKTNIIDLSGKTLYGQMTAKPILVETAASSGPVLIQAAAVATIVIEVKNLKPKTANAKFPAQSVISKDEIVIYDFGDAEIKKIKIKSGIMRFDIKSTIQEEMTIDYSIPHALKNGVPFKKTLVVGAAPASGSTVVRADVDLSGYEIDLRGKNPVLDDTVNSFYNILDVTIDSTGKTTTISLDDSIYLYYGLLDLVPEYAEGYFGKQELVYEGTENIDFFNNLSGYLDFENVGFSVDIINGVGADAELKFDYIIGSGRENPLPLSGSALNPVNLSRATYPPLTPSVKQIPFNSGNSNIGNFIKNMPPVLDYGLKLSLASGAKTYNNFITDKSEVVATFNANIPASLKTDLVLLDTVKNNLADNPDIMRVSEAALNILADNGFPFEIKLQIYLLDQNNNLLDSLVFPPKNVLQAGTMDAQTNKVIQKKQSVLVVNAGPDKMHSLRAADKMVVKASLNTPPSGSYYKIYNSYSLDLNVTADFFYDQNF